MSGLDLEKTIPSQFMPLNLGKTARDTLQEFIDIDVSADDLVRILNHNQVYKDLFSRFVESKTKSGDDKDKKTSGTHRLINLLGMIGSRNLIVAIRVHKAIEGRFPVLEDGTVDIKTGNYLKLASEIEETFIRNKMEYSEMAFAAALYFDWFNCLAAKGNSKKIEPFLTDTWRRAQRTSYVAYHLAENLPAIASKFAVAAGFLTQAGKLHMAMSFGDAYLDFHDEMEEKKMLPLPRLLLEREKFGVVPEELGAYSLFYYDIFQELYPVIRYFREPYCLKGIDKTNYTFASMLSLAHSMAESWKLPVDEKDPVIQDWASPAAKNLKLKSSTLIQVMKQSMAKT